MQPVVPAAPGLLARWEDGSHPMPLGMSPAASLPTSLQRALEQRRLLKVIAGLANFDSASVARVARAAAAGGRLKRHRAGDGAADRRYFICRRPGFY